ncbi:MAG: hypothetical protein K5829_07235 [Treponema sp.]|nr:hypothetical protein [Treponema sp.]
MKKIFIFLLFTLLSTFLFSLNTYSDKSVKLFRQAKLYYETQEYGKALRAAEDALYYRKEQVEKEKQIIINTLSSPEVKKAGDKISSIIPVILEREEIDSVDLINYYVKKKGIEYFNDSITELQKYIAEQEFYPESQKLIGDIYKLEGEYEFAEDYYKNALSHSDVFDIPDEKFEILYLLVDISQLQEDYDQMELRLLNIIGTEEHKKNASLVRAIKNTLSKNDKSVIQKFFDLYRLENIYSLKAYSMLGEYYFSLNEYDKAFEYCVLSVLTGFTRMYQIIEKRNISFEYSGIESLFEELVYHEDIIEWGRSNNIWYSFSLLCEISNILGYKQFASDLLKILARSAPEKYWQQEAVLKLDQIDGVN